MRSIVLPFDEHPLVCQYLLSAYTLGIIQANAMLMGKDISPWLYSKYINCSYKKDYSNESTANFSVQVFDGNATNDNVLSIIELHIPKKEIELREGIRFLELLRSLISSRYYITGMFNEKHIPQMTAYKRYDYPHSFLLYGFDDEKRQFLSTGFLNNQRFSSYCIDYQTFFNSILDCNGNENLVIKVIKFNEEKEFIVNYPRFIQVFSDYIHSENNMRTGYPEGELFGIRAVTSLAVDFLKKMEQGELLDIRYSRGISDSKRLVAKAVQFLNDHFKLSLNECIGLSKEVSQSAYQIHMFTLMYNVTLDIGIKDKIDSLFRNIIMCEKQYIPNLIRKLKQIKTFPAGTFLG